VLDARLVLGADAFDQSAALYAALLGLQVRCGLKSMAVIVCSPLVVLTNDSTVPDLTPRVLVPAGPAALHAHEPGPRGPGREGVDAAVLLEHRHHAHLPRQQAGRRHGRVSASLLVSCATLVTCPGRVRQGRALVDAIGG
jgi:hypothetical protein